MNIEIEAVNHIIRDNYNIQCLLGEQRLKEVLIELYVAGCKRGQEVATDNSETDLDDTFEDTR